MKAPLAVIQVFTVVSLILLKGVLADIDVQVGEDGQLRFSPETVFGQPGELVNFHFHGSIHTASESTARLRDPCNTEGGFDSGIQPDGAVYTILISTHNSIYVHCTPHCGNGMVMIVNPGPNDSVDTFRQVAEAANGGGSGGGTNSTSNISSTSRSSTTPNSSISVTTAASASSSPSHTSITTASSSLDTTSTSQTSPITITLLTSTSPVASSTMPAASSVLATPSSITANSNSSSTASPTSAVAKFMPSDASWLPFLTLLAACSLFF